MSNPPCGEVWRCIMLATEGDVVKRQMLLARARCSASALHGGPLACKIH